jgi:hypothetical protein
MAALPARSCSRVPAIGLQRCYWPPTPLDGPSDAAFLATYVHPRSRIDVANPETHDVPFWMRSMVGLAGFFTLTHARHRAGGGARWGQVSDSTH